jgi:hypothetical protein
VKITKSEPVWSGIYLDVLSDLRNVSHSNNKSVQYSSTLDSLFLRTFSSLYMHT